MAMTMDIVTSREPINIVTRGEPVKEAMSMCISLKNPTPNFSFL